MVWQLSRLPVLALTGIVAAFVGFRALPSLSRASLDPAISEALLAKSDLWVALGASPDAVRRAYPAVSELADMNSNGKFVYCKADSAGLSFYFGKRDLRLRSIRVDQAFKGQVLGLSIGDSLGDILLRLGRPSKADVSPQNPEESYHYKMSERWSVSFSVTKQDMRDSGGFDKGRITTIVLHE